MTIYRAYTLNGVNHSENAVWIEADSDTEVLAKAREMMPLQCEVWERDRLVGRLNGDPRLPTLWAPDSDG